MGPDLHNGVLELDLVGVSNELIFVLCLVLHVVVVDEVECNLVFWLIEFHLDFLSCVLEVSPLLHHTFEFIIGQFEAADRCQTGVICISGVFHDECLVIQNSTCGEPLYHELLLVRWSSLIIWD